MAYEHQSIIEVCTSEMNANMTSEFHHKNIFALSKLKELGVKLGAFPDDVNRAGKKALYEVIDELSTKNKDFAQVYESVEKYLELSRAWSDVSLKNFLNNR